jgi:hypothetical protein
MPAPPILIVEGLVTFVKCVRQFRKSWVLTEKPKTRGERRTLWFRGQHNPAWGLSPQIYRPVYAEADEAEMRQEFQSQAIQLIQGRLPTNEYEWYFLMQHYGVPTRLLDWTDNPLMSLFFAVHDHPRDSDAAVWVLDPWWLNGLLRKGIEGPLLPDWEEAGSYLRNLEQAFGAETVTRAKVPAAIDPPHVDRRLAAQGSHFVIFGKQTDLTNTKAARRKNARLAKIVIPKANIPSIWNELQDYGINYFSVFPDLTGLGLEIRSKWRGSTKIPRIGNRRARR